MEVPNLAFRPFGDNLKATSPTPTLLFDETTQQVQ
jgi:hypothetical protein